MTTSRIPRSSFQGSGTPDASLEGVKPAPHVVDQREDLLVADPRPDSWTGSGHEALILGRRTDRLATIVQSEHLEDLGALDVLDPEPVLHPLPGDRGDPRLAGGLLLAPPTGQPRPLDAASEPLQLFRVHEPHLVSHIQSFLVLFSPR